MRLEPGEIIQMTDWDLAPDFYYVVKDATNFNLSNGRMVLVHNLKWGCDEKITLQPWEDNRPIENKLLGSLTLPQIRLFGRDLRGGSPLYRKFVTEIAILDLRKK